MSSYTGMFDGFTYTGGNNKQRMAGDYLKDFTASNQNGYSGYKSRDFNSARKTEDVSTASNEPSNVSQALDNKPTQYASSGNRDASVAASMPIGKPGGVSTVSNKSSNLAQVLRPKPPVKRQPAKEPTPVAENNSGIDFRAWAEDTVNNGKSSGQDADYWEKTYRNNHNQYLANKAIVDNHQGPGNWDEFNSRDQSRRGTTGDRNQGTMTSYGDFTNYMTAKQGVDHWENASSKWSK